MVAYLSLKGPRPRAIAAAALIFGLWIFLSPARTKFHARARTPYRPVLKRDLYRSVEGFFIRERVRGSGRQLADYECVFFKLREAEAKRFATVHEQKFVINISRNFSRLEIIAMVLRLIHSSFEKDSQKNLILSTVKYISMLLNLK